MGLVKSMMHLEARIPEPPPEAYVNNYTREVDNGWLQNAGPADQVAALVQWFLARFCDPAEETPYMSSEGGYIWIHGGPYEAQEEIEERFHDLVPDEVIEKAVDLVQSDGIYDWAPTHITYYDASFDVDVDERNEPTIRLEQRLRQLKMALTLEGDASAREVVRNLAYGGVVAALETFLWETMTYWVDHADTTIRNLILKHPVFRDREVKLGQIYDLHGRLVDEVKAHMQIIVWHRPEQVGPMFKYGLGIDLGFRGFDDAIRKRHDIVHRSGSDVDRRQIIIADNDVANLAEQVLKFANHVDEKISESMKESP